MGCNLQLVDKK
jgi:hypothetical protein